LHNTENKIVIPKTAIVISVRGDPLPKYYYLASLIIVGETAQPTLTKIKVIVVVKLTEFFRVTFSRQLKIYGTDKLKPALRTIAAIISIERLTARVNIKSF
jgi:hypothetical protein